MKEKRSLMLDDEQLSEKFVSKAQQRYFYAKCDDGSNKEEREWCDMADEFSDDMTKKDWKKLPEKKKSKKTSKKESIDENKLLSLVKEKENPRMTKKGLMEYINSKKVVKTISKKDMVSESFGSEGLGKKLRYFRGEKGALQKVIKYLETLRESGLENMFGVYPMLNWAREDLERYLYGKRMDLDSIEDDETYEIIEYLLDNKQEIRDILIRVALRKADEVDNHDSNAIQRYFNEAAKEAFMIWVSIKN